MSSQTVNLDTYSLSLLTAKEDILNPRSSTNWAIFTYDGITNKLKLADSGAGGLAELAGKFHISKPQYGLCKVGSVETGGPRIALISWVGQNVEDFRRTECASHIPAIRNFFKEAHAFISAEKVEDVTEEKIRAELSKAQAQTSTQWVRRSSRSADKEELVGTNYRKTNAAMEMRRINRDSFWARAEREEEERKEEEKRRATEERRRLERERVSKERRDAEERDRKMNEKLQMIEEQRRKQAEQEEALHRKEKLKWEQQQREHMEDMRARLRRSESIEKAAEAAALVSQRSMNPREFFRQLSSSSSSQSPLSPGSSRTGKPFRRYQRSLTDTAFIFSKAEESSSSSPYSSPLVSPFSRAPISPVFRATSPPTSPDFRPVTSPQRPRAPMSPPTSPLRPAPPVSALPSVPQTNNQDQAVVEPSPPSPTEPSAPPASPTLLASLSPSLVKNDFSLSVSPTNAPTQPEHLTFCFESGEAPQAPTAPLPQSPQSLTDLTTATGVHTELVSDFGYKVQAVLVEEDEEEDAEEQEEDEKQPEPCAVTAEPIRSEVEEQAQEVQAQEEKAQEVRAQEDQAQDEEAQEEEAQEAQEEEAAQTQEAQEKQEEEAQAHEAQEEEAQEEAQVQEAQEEQVQEEQAQAEEEDKKEEEEEGGEQEAECGPLVEVVQVVQEEENDQSGDSQTPTEPAELSKKGDESAFTDSQSICQVIKHETVVLSTNGITNGGDAQEQNGTARSLSPSDTELSSPELTGCYGTAEENDVQDELVSENGQEGFTEQQMCVRALYDYQAEDESEISFEPGDIIKDVETVDKAWWRGWSKDGRQGLFPANYVETI